MFCCCFPFAKIVTASITVGCSTGKASLWVNAISFSPSVTKRIGVVSNIVIVTSRTEIRSITALRTSRSSYRGLVTMTNCFAVGCVTNRASLWVNAISLGPGVSDSLSILKYFFANLAAFTGIVIRCGKSTCSLCFDKFAIGIFFS